MAMLLTVLEIVVIGGTIPMLFVFYTTAPYVNYIYLMLPAFAQQTTQRTQAYLANLPRSATLKITTMNYDFRPRYSVAPISDLVLKSSKTRPVTFMNTKPQPRSWWKGKDTGLFFTSKKVRLPKSTPKFYPEVWDQVLTLMKNKNNQVSAIKRTK